MKSFLPYWKIIAAILCPIVIIFLIYGALWWKSLGGYEPAEHWLSNVYHIKKIRGSQVDQPKLIIAAGSNALFGIDSSLLAEELGLPVVNLSGHAGNTFSFLIENVLDAAKKGDIVIMPLEYQYYGDEGGLTAWQSANMESWGSEHIKRSSVADKLNYLRHSNLNSILMRLLSPNGPSAPQTDDPKDVALDFNEKTLGEKISHWQNYNYRSLTYWGDILVDAIPNDDVTRISQNGFIYLGRSSLGSAFIKNARYLRDKLNARGAELYFTWPVSMQNEKFDLTKSHYKELANSLKGTALKHNLNYICTPEKFHYDKNYFYDSAYHLNFAGAVKRSLYLAQCLKEEVDKFKNTPPVLIERSLDIYIRKSGRDMSLALRQLADLELISLALARYKADLNHYPVSKEWDGIYSSYGESSSNWIKGLAPKYIKELPRDPRLSKDGEVQYLYKSNGNDYKLIAHGVWEDCGRVKTLRDNYIDPVRNCWAYSIWTPSAERW